MKPVFVYNLTTRMKYKEEWILVRTRDSIKSVDQSESYNVAACYTLDSEFLMILAIACRKSSASL
jgi:hypothetical protein